MFKILAFLGGGSFIVNGIRVLFDSSCDRVGLGYQGARIFTATCYDSNSYIQEGVPRLVGGFGMILVGVVIWGLLAASASR